MTPVSFSTLTKLKWSRIIVVLFVVKCSKNEPTINGVIKMQDVKDLTVDSVHSVYLELTPFAGASKRSKNKETESGKQKPSIHTLNAVGTHRSVYVHDNFMPRGFFSSTSPLFFFSFLFIFSPFADVCRSIFFSLCLCHSPTFHFHFYYNCVLSNLELVYFFLRTMVCVDVFYSG